LRGGSVGEERDQIVISIVRKIAAAGVAQLIRRLQDDGRGAFALNAQLHADIARPHWRFGFPGFRDQRFRRSCDRLDCAHALVGFTIEPIDLLAQCN